MLFYEDLCFKSITFLRTTAPYLEQSLPIVREAWIDILRKDKTSDFVSKCWATPLRKHLANVFLCRKKPYLGITQKWSKLEMYSSTKYHEWTFWEKTSAWIEIKNQSYITICNLTKRQLITNKTQEHLVLELIPA